MTPLAFPMVHDTIPKVGVKSYISKPQIPYTRIPGFQKIKRNDIVVFNWPVDTLINITPGQMRGSVQKPIDKKSNYVKRCVGLPGDSLSVKNGYVYIDGKQNVLPDRAKVQFAYEVYAKKALVQTINGKYTADPIPFMVDRYNITDIYVSGIDRENQVLIHTAHLTKPTAEKLKNNPDVLDVVQIEIEEGYYDESVFPNDAQYEFNNNYFGPIYIPEAGKTVAINAQSIPFYRRIIEVYEGTELGIDNKITQNGTQVLLNGSPITEYTFKMDYYWLMGDNRNNSQDARLVLCRLITWLENLYLFGLVSTTPIRDSSIGVRVGSVSLPRFMVVGNLYLI
ncbi:unnamed protein product [Pylaiella littoralis]